MTQLRLAWSNSKPSEIKSLNTKKKPAKCERCSTVSGALPSLWKKFERLRQERPVAAALIERLVDDSLAEMERKTVSGLILE